MNTIKLAVFDIDGTLLSRNSSVIEPSTVRAIHQLKEKGIQVLVATGRALYFIKDHVREVLDCDYYVTINGGCLLDHKGNIIKAHPMSNEDVEFVTELMDRYGGSLSIKTSKEMIIYRDFAHFTSTYGHSFNLDKYFIDDTKNRNYHSTIESCKGIFAFSNHVKEILAEIKTRPSLIAHQVDEYGMDILSKESDKTKGIEEVLQIAGLGWENTIAFGDEDNDFGMISKAAIGVVMGNGSDEMKAIADYITSNVDDSGIEKALKHYKLIESD